MPAVCLPVVSSVSLYLIYWIAHTQQMLPCHETIPEGPACDSLGTLGPLSQGQAAINHASTTSYSVTPHIPTYSVTPHVCLPPHDTIHTRHQNTRSQTNTGLQTDSIMIESIICLLFTFVALISDARAKCTKGGHSQAFTVSRASSPPNPWRFQILT